MNKIKYEKTNLVIADAGGPCSLAGVMGGMGSSISDSTKNIVIEVAVFDPACVRKSSRQAGVESESKRRFERGVDRAGAKRALLRAIELLSLYACKPGQKIKVGKILVAGSEDIAQKSVSLKLSEIKRHLGIDIPADIVINLLARLGFSLVEKSLMIIALAINLFVSTAIFAPFFNTFSVKTNSCFSIVPVKETPSRASLSKISSLFFPKYSSFVKPACRVPIIAAALHLS